MGNIYKTNLNILQQKYMYHDTFLNFPLHHTRATKTKPTYTELLIPHLRKYNIHFKPIHKTPPSSASIPTVGTPCAEIIQPIKLYLKIIPLLVAHNITFIEQLLTKNGKQMISWQRLKNPHFPRRNANAYHLLTQILQTPTVRGCRVGDDAGVS